MSQKEYKATSDAGISMVYNIQNGLFEGQYTSFHANGVKKSSGQFMHNLRKGVWTVWDSTGKMVHQRECENPISHKQIFPQPTAKAENVSVTTNDKQSEGFVELPNVTDKNIIFSKTYWRTIMNKEQNPLLFENNRVLKFLTTNILSGKINAYGNADRSWQKLSIGEYQKRLDSLNLEVVGFQIKETFYFDKQRQTGQISILGIAPITRLKDGSTAPQYWVSMPAIRKFLFDEKLNDSKLLSDIKNLDDVFFKRNFASYIFKEANINNRPISDSISDPDDAPSARKIELEMIETEHNLWSYAQ